VQFQCDDKQSVFWLTLYCVLQVYSVESTYLLAVLIGEPGLVGSGLDFVFFDVFSQVEQVCFTAVWYFVYFLLAIVSFCCRRQCC